MKLFGFLSSRNRRGRTFSEQTIIRRTIRVIYICSAVIRQGCKVSLPLGKVSLPLGKVSVSAGKVSLPSGKVSMLAGKVSLPNVRMTLPRGKIGFAAGKSRCLGGTILDFSGTASLLAASPLDVRKGCSAVQ